MVSMRSNIDPSNRFERGDGAASVASLARGSRLDYVSCMPNPVVHFQIGGRHADSLREFYESVFGWDVDEPAPIGAIRTDAGVGIDGGVHQVDENQRPYLAVYVAVDDLMGTISRAEEGGATIIVPPTDVDGVGSFAMFQDPEGNCIGLWHHPVN